MALFSVSTAVRSGAELKTLTARKDGHRFQINQGDMGSKVKSDLPEKTAPPSNFHVVKSPEGGIPPNIFHKLNFGGSYV